MIYLLKCLVKLKKQACSVKTRGGAFTQDSLYPEGHPKRHEKDSQMLDEMLVAILKRRRRNTKELEKLMVMMLMMKSRKILIVYPYLMLKLKVEMNTLIILMRKMLLI